MRFSGLVVVGIAGILMWNPLTGAVAADESPIAKFGTVQLRASDLKRLLDGQSPELRAQLASTPADLDQFIRSELVRRAMLAEALSKGVEKRPEVILAMERAKDQAIVAAYANQLARPPAEFPSQGEIDQAYAANVQNFTVPAQYHLAQIFIKAPEGSDKAKVEAAAKRAEDLAQKARAANADFAALAKSNSEHAASAPGGGDLGWLNEGQVVPELRPVMPQLKPGQVSGVVKTAQGWHVVKLLERRDVQVLPLADVRDRLVAALRYRKAQENEQKYLSDLMAKTPITIDDAELKKLQGAFK
jgi:parvulin-like peptidyl-prolyl isomerase